MSLSDFCELEDFLGNVDTAVRVQKSQTYICTIHKAASDSNQSKPGLKKWMIDNKWRNQKVAKLLAPFPGSVQLATGIVTP